MRLAAIFERNEFRSHMFDLIVFRRFLTTPSSSQNPAWRLVDSGNDTDDSKEHDEEFRLRWLWETALEVRMMLILWFRDYENTKRWREIAFHATICKIFRVVSNSLFRSYICLIENTKNKRKYIQILVQVYVHLLSLLRSLKQNLGFPLYVVGTKISVEVWKTRHDGVPNKK